MHTRTRRILAVGDERGFTLVELMMVMVIIGVLAGLGFTGYNVLQRRMAVTRADVYWRDLNYGVFMYKLEGRGFPDDIDDLANYLDVDAEPWKSASPVPAGGPPETGVYYLLEEEDPNTGRPACVMVWVDGFPLTKNDKRCPFMSNP